MTEMQKWRFRQHWNKWNVAYVTVFFLASVVVVIGLEAKGII
tara:strand:+ start:203 stop:328 length:126 start_codon:yes stop_codon:yes gene_type:complete